MEQRPLRLGDILDDYCPRERRVTNHAVVAMVEDTVKQTRCTTCDAEHAYKGGQAPRRRKKETSSALFKEVLAGKPETDAPVRVEMPEALVHVDVADDVDVDVEVEVAPFVPERLEEPSVEDMPAMLAGAGDGDAADEPQPEIEDGPVHRQLIRATLPRIEGQKDERRPTDFTIRQSIGRGGNAHGHNFRGNDRGRSGRGHGNSGAGNSGGNNANRGNGHRSQGGFRFAGQRQGQGQGQGQGRGQGGNFRSGQQQRQGGRKRSR
jgi:hypothetical protein